jgi:hypothetical protein
LRRSEEIRKQTYTAAQELHVNPTEMNRTLIQIFAAASVLDIFGEQIEDMRKA